MARFISLCKTVNQSDKTKDFIRHLDLVDDTHAPIAVNKEQKLAAGLL